MKALFSLVLAAAAALAQTPAKSAARPAPRPGPLFDPGALRATAPPAFRVQFTTTRGDFVVEVHRDWAPHGADRFYNLVRNRFFTNVAFFRVVPGSIVQFGMSPDPAVTKAWANATIPDDPPQQSDSRGTLVFATRGPNTRTTQLFINLANNTPYDRDYIPIGTVVDGMDVVDGIYGGYGQMPDQNRIEAQGKPYLDQNFPKLDSIRMATIIFPEAHPPVKKAAPAPVKK